MTSIREPILAVCFRSSRQRPTSAVYTHGELDTWGGLSTYLETDMLVPQPDLELLAPILVLLGPLGVVLLHDLGRAHDALDLVDHQTGNAHLLADQAVVAIVAVVGVACGGGAPIADCAHVELEELVSETAAVAGAGVGVSAGQLLCQSEWEGEGDILVA